MKNRPRTNSIEVEIQLRHVLAILIGLLGAHSSVLLAQDAIAIDELDRITPVDFHSEVLPILRANCLACHNASHSESELSLESPAAIRQGGSLGPAVVAGRSAESLLLKVAAHEQQEFMPPADNKIGARPLTGNELGLIKLWIDQGAQGEAALSRRIEFQALPPGVAPIFAAAVTADGKYAACGRGKTIDVYHVPTRQLVARLEGHNDVVRSLAFDRSGRWLASGGFRQVKLWRRPHVDLLAAFKVDGAATAVAISVDGKLIAIGREDGKIAWREVDAVDETVKLIGTHTAAITGLAFAPDGKSLVSASQDKTIRLHRIAGEEPSRTITKPAEITALALVNGGNWIVTGHADNVIRVWESPAQDGEGSAAQPRLEIKGHSQPVTALANSTLNPNEVISASSDGTLRRWNVETGDELRTWNHGEPITAAAIRPDGKRAASAGRTSVKLWNAEDGSLIAELKGDPRAAAEVERIDAQLAFTKSAIQLAQNDIKSYEGPERRVKTTAEAVKKAEDEELAKAEKTLKEKQEALANAKEKGDEKAIEKAQKELADAETSRGVALTIIERAKVVAERAVQELADAQASVAQDEAKLKQLEIEKSAAEAAARSAQKPICSLAFTADNRRLIAAREDGLVVHYDANFGSPLDTFAGEETPITALAAAEGKVLQASESGNVKLHSVAGDWQLARTVGRVDDAQTIADRALALAFSPNGKRLAVGGGLPSRSGELKIFNTADGKLAREFASAHADTILSVDFSPAGKHLATAAADRLVKVFDVEQDALVHAFAGHTAHVTGVSFSGDGKLLVSSGADKVLKLWDAQAGTPIHTMKGTTYRIGPYRREVTAAKFIGGSEQILAASGDGTVRLHRTSSENDILTFADSTGYIYAAAVSDDGRTVVAGGADGVLRMWSGHERSVRFAFGPGSP